MYFKKIYMHGFKSFAEPVTIEFNDGITCIVGPNGSGKSNISDALRWVLGEQSPKALRGGKMDEVIFAGTASRKSRGMAEVTLTIDNSTGILPIDYNEVAITRRMYRSGQSEYLINNNQCRLRDIRELIMDTGIGVDGYSIIGQGRIADIVSNKPESRREIFEEAAGIVMYRTKKEDVEKKLASSNANLERVNDIVSEIEGRIGNLKEDSEKATQYLELRDRYRDLEVNITLKNIENIELKMEYLKDDIAEASVQIEGFKEEKLEIDKASSESRVRSEALETLTNESQAKLIAVIDEINTLVNRSEVNRERIIAIDDNRSRLSLEIEALSERLEKEREGAEGLISDKEKIDAELKRLDEILKEQVSKYEEMTKVLGDEAASIDEQRSSIYEL
ncbi:MAG: AAA family ATPase, partial [Firmicutes bacterium]|nr:AAA family ATPase [Bacillota bacterium]